MTATLLVHGTIRAAKKLRKRDTGEVFGTEVSVLTEVGEVLGESLGVLFFNPRGGEVYPSFEPGRRVTWVVEVDGNRYGVSSTFKQEATPEDLASLNADGVATFNFPAAVPEPVGL